MGGIDQFQKKALLLFQPCQLTPLKQCGVEGLDRLTNNIGPAFEPRVGVDLHPQNTGLTEHSAFLRVIPQGEVGENREKTVRINILIKTFLRTTRRQAK